MKSLMPCCCMIKPKNWSRCKMAFKHINGTDLTTYQEVLLWASSFLNKSGEEPFAAEWLMKEMFDLTKTELINLFREEMHEERKQAYLQNVKKHAEGIPVQQILGHEWFYGRKFIVSEDTLIPRTETEELIELILTQAPTGSQRILDIGTGTGAIACTL